MDGVGHIHDESFACGNPRKPTILRRCNLFLYGESVWNGGIENQRGQKHASTYQSKQNKRCFSHGRILLWREPLSRSSSNFCPARYGKGMPGDATIPAMRKISAYSSSVSGQIERRVFFRNFILRSNLFSRSSASVT